jgi:uncharacterized caspase-like protein
VTEFRAPPTSGQRAHDAARAPWSARNERVALVIGISEYRWARKLTNPVRDRSVEAALKDLGFDVMMETDRTERRLRAALDDFAAEYRDAEVVLVFFAGHGVQIGGRNFLLPTDAQTASIAALRQSALALDDVFARVAAVAPRRIILLDACRNDPFGGEAAGDDGRGLAEVDDAASAIAPGLGRIGRADGTLYAFATAPGTAADGLGEHSPFAEALVTHLGKRGFELGAIMKLVQMDVYERTCGRQLPYIEDALPEIVFVDGRREGLRERDHLLLAMAKIDGQARAQIERIAASNDMPLAPLFGALLAIEAEGVANYEAREKLLARAAEDFAKVRLELTALASSDPEVARLRARAEHDLSVGAFEAARAALTEAIEVDRAAGERIEARLKERNLSQAASLSARAGVALTRLDYRAAGADLAAAARLAGRWDEQLAWRYGIEQGESLFNHGCEFGDNLALTESISICRASLELAPRGSRPDDWAMTQYVLGRALWRLGERESSTARLEEAVAAFEAALQEQTRERAPLDWAKNLHGLAGVLSELGRRESGTARLEEAVAVLRRTLEVLTRDRVPFAWAGAQNNLGVTLNELGRREAGTARLDEAAAAFREALKEYRRENVPLDWAATQNNLGIALSELGRRAGGTAHLEEAIVAYREALKELSRDRVPLDWALTQNNLGTALGTLGEREDGATRLEEAVVAFREALKERTRERDPIAWAITQINLGKALGMVGARTDRIGVIEEAVTAMRAALDIFASGGASHFAAIARENLGAMEKLRADRTQATSGSVDAG